MTCNNTIAAVLNLWPAAIYLPGGPKQDLKFI